MYFLIIFVNLITIGHAVVSHHWEERNDNCVKGGYSFLDADGRVRVVQYHVDGNKGFRAFVTFRRPGGDETYDKNVKYPFWHQNPVWFHAPVGKITRDLLYGKMSYPNINIY